MIVYNAYFREKVTRKFIEESDSYKTMVCVAHKDNTISKAQWLRKDIDDTSIKSKLSKEIQSHLDILSQLNI